jgi:hypothetical protein
VQADGVAKEAFTAEGVIPEHLAPLVFELTRVVADPLIPDVRGVTRLLQETAPGPGWDAGDQDEHESGKHQQQRDNSGLHARHLPDAPPAHLQAGAPAASAWATLPTRPTCPIS